MIVWYCVNWLFKTEEDLWFVVTQQIIFTKISQSKDCINLRPIHIYTHTFLHLIFYHIIGSLNCKVAKKNGSAASPGEPHDNLPGTPCTNGRVWAGFQHQFCKIHTWVIHICNIMLSIRCRLALLLTVE